MPSTPPVQATGHDVAVAPALEGSMDLPPGTVVGEYQVVGKLGEGGMGAVYSAQHPLIGKKAAIKVISPMLCTDASAVERFVQEARAVNQIGHPNIVDVFSFGELSDGRSYFVMEWLQGSSLADRLSAGSMPLGEVIDILDQMSDALEAAHEKGIVHRDLKPDNVFLVTVRGNRQLVKLIDFGIARLADSGDGRIAKTRTGMMMGTPGYLSPEQARGKNVDHRTDIYALGCMTYEMVLGRLPFDADNAMDIVLKHLTEPPPTPSLLWPEIPPILEQLILRMLEKDVERRPTLHEVRAVLSELHGNLLATLASTGHAHGITGIGMRSRTPSPPMDLSTRGTPPPGTVKMEARPGTLASAAGIGRPGTVPGTMPRGQVASEALDDEIRPKKKRGALIGSIVGAAALLGVVVFAAVGGKTRDAKPTARVEPIAAPVARPTPAPAQPDQEPKASEPQGATAQQGATPTPTPAPAILVVKASAPNSRIEVDGRVYAEAADGARIQLDREGNHELVVTAPMRKPFIKTVSVASGATVEVEARLERQASAAVAKPGTPGKPADKKPGKKKPGGCTDCTIDPFAN
ncbi:MAG: serine/threonine protein kinase [Deltaproteobacteria bacterium]|nr:serine/threonine protein kinase [Deltaproteobacteria bacterium]